jgi:hypothetical protein
VQFAVSVPALRDRVTQAATLLVLGPIFETDLLPNQYGFRAGVDAKPAPPCGLIPNQLNINTLPKSTSIGS